MAHPAATFEEGYQPFSFTQPIVNDGNVGLLADVVPSSSKNDGPKDALSQLYELGQKDPAYMETYLQLLAERENTANAQKWYERMSDSSYQRAYKDLEKAGINPYLALQSLGGAGSGSVAPAGSWSTSPYANKVSKQQAENQAISAQANMVKAIMGAGTAIAAILALLI